MRFDHVLNVQYPIDSELAFLKPEVSFLTKRCESFKHDLELRHLKVCVLSKLLDQSLNPSNVCL